MGMLALGAMKGASDEYLKQGDEKRKSKYQEIRDRRLAEIQSDQNIQRAELTSTEAQRAEGVAQIATEQNQGYLSKEAELAGARKTNDNRDTIKGRSDDNRANIDASLHNAPTDVNTYDSKGNLIQQGVPDPATGGAGSAANLQFMHESVELKSAGEAGTGTRRKSGDLYKEWRKLAYDEHEDEMGKTFSRNDELDWVAWHNSMVIDADYLKPSDPKYLVGDPDALLELAEKDTPNFQYKREASIAKLKEQYPWWNGPEKKSGGMLSSGASQDPRNTEPDAEKTPGTPPDDSLGIVSQGSGGQGESNQAPRGVTSRNAITGPLRKKLIKLEAELAALSTKGGRAGSGSKAKVLQNEINTIEGMLSGE